MVIRDLKYALRLLSKKPGFSLLTVMVMATGIGLSLFLFSFLNTIMFKALPFEDGDSLVQISASHNGARNNRPLDLHDYHEIRSSLRGISEFSAYRSVDLNVSGRDGTRRYLAVAAEPNFFEMTRTKPVLGRGFNKSENLQGGERVVVLGYDMWQNQFGGDAGIIDQKVLVNGISHRIVGVMPEGYFFPSNAEMWTPLREDATQMTRGSAGQVYGIAHLSDNASMKEVNKQLGVIMQRLEQRYPKENSGINAYVETIQKATVGDGIAIIYSLYVVAVLILLLASINVGNLLLSRAVERGKETAIRVALGAPRLRLISQMLWESIIICTLGGIIGLLMLTWGLGLTETVTESFFSDRPRFWWKFGVDSYTIQLFVVFILGTVLITGVLPAWRNSGGDFNSALRDGTRGALSKKSGRLNQLLVISEIFISMTVLIAATVAVIATYQTTNADYGAEPDNILTAKVQLTESKYDTGEKQVQFFKTLEANLQGSAGMGEVMISSALPAEFARKPSVAVEGREYGQGASASYPKVNYVAVMPGSLMKLGIELKQGRYFNSSDDGLNNTTVVVTDSFVERYLSGEEALGKRVRVVDQGEVKWLTIVGVVEHTIQGVASRSSRYTPSVFRPLTQEPRTQMTIAMKMKSSETEMTRTLRSVLKSIDPELPAFKIEPYQARMERNIAPLKFITSLFMLFGIAGVILAASGIYGVMSNTVNQRSQEIGVKRALGGTEETIVKEYLMRGAKQLLWGGIPGLLAGSAMGFGMSKVIAAGTAALALPAISVALLIGAVVIFATYLPTWRVLEMEPIDALRNE